MDYSDHGDRAVESYDDCRRLYPTCLDNSNQLDKVDWIRHCKDVDEENPIGIHTRENRHNLPLTRPCQSEDSKNQLHKVDNLTDL